MTASKETKESVDDYTQALRKLFKKAYSTVLRGEPEADSMGRTVLANQFVSGLQMELKSKVVGTEGKPGATSSEGKVRGGQEARAGSQ